MAGPAPKTKDWTARENKHKPKGLHVIVSGLVEVSDTNKTPVLKEGGVAIEHVLPLTLTIEACSDPAIQVKVWKSTSFHKEVTANQYDRVVVSWDGKQIAAFPVIDDREHTALMSKQTAAQNSVAKVKTVKSKAAKKSTPKKTAKKKKAVGGAAKGKKAKKSAKKSAKKTSALKKLVRKVVRKLSPASKKKRK